MENNITEKNEYHLRAAELKNRVFESLLSPDRTNRDEVQRYIEELQKIDPKGKYLDKQMMDFCRRYMDVQAPQTKAQDHWISRQARGVYRRSRLRKWVCVIIVIGVLYMSLFPKLEIALYRLDPNVDQPVLFSELYGDDQNVVWRQPVKAVKIACDNTGLQMIFPSWMPENLVCTRVCESFSSSYNSVDINFVDLEQVDAGSKPAPFIWIEIFKPKYNAIDANGGITRIIWDIGTHYTIRQINGRDYYIGADINGQGYIAVFTDKQYVYTVTSNYDFDTNIRILESMRTF